MTTEAVVRASRRFSLVLFFCDLTHFKLTDTHFLSITNAYVRAVSATELPNNRKSQSNTVSFLVLGQKACLATLKWSTKGWCYKKSGKDKQILVYYMVNSLVTYDTVLQCFPILDQTSLPILELQAASHLPRAPRLPQTYVCQWERPSGSTHLVDDTLWKCGKNCCCV